jgi:hypothetical protein
MVSAMDPYSRILGFLNRLAKLELINGARGSVVVKIQ